MFNIHIFNVLGKKVIFDESTFTLQIGDICHKLSAVESYHNAKKVYLKLNSQCNAACDYCFQRNDSKTNVNQKISLLDYEQLLYKISEKCDLLIMYGGEPFLDQNKENWSFLLESAIYLHIKAYTNGYFSSKYVELISYYSKQFEMVSFSIDGPEIIHNNRRPYYGNGYAKAMSNISQIIGKVPVTIQVNVDKENVHTIDELMSSLSDAFPSNTYYVALNRVLHSPNTIEEIDFLNNCLKLKKKHYYQNYFINSPVLYKIKSLLNNSGPIYTRCSIGDSLVFDFENGEIYTCPHDSTTKIGEFDYADYYLSNDRVVLFKTASNTNSKDKCVSCSVKALCGLGCAMDPSEPIDICVPKTQQVIQFVFDNYTAFFGANKH